MILKNSFLITGRNTYHYTTTILDKQLENLLKVAETHQQKKKFKCKKINTYFYNT